MRIVEHGWVVAQPYLPPEVSGIYIPKETRTRREEYTLVRGLAPEGSTLLDIATGFIPQWHLFARVMAEEGWLVEAIDTNPGVMQLPAHPQINYHIADGRDIPFADHSFDYVTCISTLEHLEPADQRIIVAEMLRCVRPGGRIVVTADNAPWLPILFGADKLEVTQPEGPAAQLSPSVYYICVDA